MGRLGALFGTTKATKKDLTAAHEKRFDYVKHDKKNLYKEGDTSAGAKYYNDSRNFKTKEDKEKYLNESPENRKAWQEHKANKEDKIDGYSDYRASKKDAAGASSKAENVLGSAGFMGVTTTAMLAPVAIPLFQGSDKDKPQEEPPPAYSATDPSLPAYTA
jgi:hypothetical protein